MPLDEITVLLLRPGVSAAARNKVWAELVRRARSGSPAWMVGLTGVALPGLTRAVGDLAAAYRRRSPRPADRGAGRVPAAVRGLDPDDLDSIPLASRLMWAAFRAGRALACADAAWAAAAATWTSPGSPRPARPGTPTSSWRPRSAAASSPPPTRS